MSERIVIRTRDRVVILSGSYAIEVTEEINRSWCVGIAWGSVDGCEIAELPTREDANRILDLLHNGILAGETWFDLRGELPARGGESG